MDAGSSASHVIMINARLEQTAFLLISWISPLVFHHPVIGGLYFFEQGRRLFLLPLECQSFNA
jgi:hypothetical protein